MSSHRCRAYTKTSRLFHWRRFQPGNRSKDSLPVTYVIPLQTVTYTSLTKNRRLARISILSVEGIPHVRSEWNGNLSEQGKAEHYIKPCYPSVSYRTQRSSIESDSGHKPLRDLWLCYRRISRCLELRSCLLCLPEQRNVFPVKVGNLPTSLSNQRKLGRAERSGKSRVLAGHRVLLLQALHLPFNLTGK